SGNTVTCTRPSLLVGATGTILITTLVPVGTTVQSFTNLASVALVGSDPVLPNNDSQQQVMIGSEAPVVLPATGRDTSAPLTTGGVMLLAGVGCLGISKRRRKV
ncbi:MAG TPA: LPXTG cell wall anchor domain-containing protein, partial [Ilumatobacteraceae bacterium]